MPARVGLAIGTGTCGWRGLETIGIGSQCVVCASFLMHTRHGSIITLLLCLLTHAPFPFHPSSPTTIQCQRTESVSQAGICLRMRITGASQTWPGKSPCSRRYVMNSRREEVQE